MKKPDLELDSTLLAYKHSLPPEAGEEMVNLVKVALAASKKGSWTRSLAVALAALLGAGFSTGLFYSKLVFKSDLSPYAAKEDMVALAKALTEQAADRQHKIETQNERLLAVEVNATAAVACCATQQHRLDGILTPRPR